jgi:GNAT superfamily N-acetyltransferase
VSQTRLPDGWGGDTSRADTLLRAYAEGWADLMELIGRGGGHRTARTADFVALDAHVPFEFGNVAVLLRPVLDPRDRVLDEIQAFFEPDDDSTPFLVWSATPMPPLFDRGWTLMGHPPLMLRAPAPATPPAPDGLDIVEVRDHAALATFDETLVEAYPVPTMRGRRNFGDGVLDAPDWHMWLGVLDGRPVGTAAALVNDAYVDVEWISTHADARGRGIGEALTWQATLAATDRPAMLFASDLGRPVYERMGYVNLARLTLWVGARSG